MCHLGNAHSIYQTVSDYNILEDIAMLAMQNDDDKAIEISLQALF